MRLSPSHLGIFHTALLITVLASAAQAAPRMVLFEEATNYG